ncbi:hypothetical protein P4S64_15300 [Vibrio sp. M60_M31a]
MVSDRRIVISPDYTAEIIGLNDVHVLGEQFYKKLVPYYQRAFDGTHIEAEITLDENGFRNQPAF